MKKASQQKAGVKANQVNEPGLLIEQTPAPVVKALTPPQILNARRILIKGEIAKNTARFAELLPKHIQPAKFTEVFMQACIANTSLLQCTPASLITCAIRSAQLGLLPDANTGEAHLIPFANPERNYTLEAQFLPGYRGLIQLAMRSGQVKKFQPRAVYQGDIFEFEYGTEEFIKHKPNRQSLVITDVYAIIEFVNGGKMFDVMSLDEIEAVRNDAPEWKNTPANLRGKTFWGTRFPDMAKKTVIRRLSKYAPISPEFQFAVSLDEKIEVIGKSQIDTENINWDELSPEEQEKILQDLLQSDQAKKETLAAEVQGTKSINRKERNASAMKQAEQLIETKQ